jgi:hypothetical protein
VGLVNELGPVGLKMDFDIYRIIAATLYISRYPLAAAAIIFCILLFRRSRNAGWLCLGVLFTEPFFLFIVRLIHGRRLLPFETMGGVTPDGAQQITLAWDFPIVYLFAVLGLFLLHRGVRQGS